MVRRRLPSVLIPILVLLLVPLHPTAAAQGTTPPVTPTARECVALPLPAGTPSPMTATPTAGTATEAAAEASPEPAPPPAGTPTDGALVERIRSAEVMLATCFATEDYLGVAALMTPRYLRVEFGVSNPYDLPVVMATLGHFTIEVLTVTDAQTHADGRVSAAIAWTFNGEPLRTRDVYVERDGDLLLDEDFLLPEEAGTSTP
jgi:hypothetical protein